MRICFITGLYPPYARGGAERVVADEARALREAGHEVAVITAEDVREDGGIEPIMSVEDGIRVHRFFPLNLFFYRDIGKHGFFARALWHLRDLSNPHASRVVARLLKEEAPDVVHTHNLKGLGFGIPRAIRRLGIRHVHTLHDVQLAVPSGLLMKGRERDAERPLARLYARAVRRLMGSPDAVLSPSRFLAKFHLDRGFFPASKVIVLPNPVPEVKRLPRRPSKETRFLFLGQVERHKGVPWLVGVFREFLKKRPMARLDIAGNGSAIGESVELAGRDVRIAFYGRQRLEDMNRLFAEADYAVVPSLCYENAPTVIGESFAHGVPVIAADIGGAAEMVRDGENGFVFEAGNEASLLAVLERAVKEKAGHAAMERAALRAAALRSSPVHASRLYEIYLGRDDALPAPGPAAPPRLHESPVTEALLASIREHARRRRAEARKEKAKAA